MSDKVISLRGGPVEQPENPEPVAEVVSALEHLLEAARTGDVDGIALIATHQGDRYTKIMLGSVVGPTALGMLTILKTEMIVELCEDD